MFALFALSDSFPGRVLKINAREINKPRRGYTKGSNQQASENTKIY